jgi:hypothetical protein
MISMAEPFPHISLTEVDDPLTSNHSTIVGVSSFFLTSREESYKRPALKKLAFHGG